MRILLTGRSGQVGWELERTLAALGEVIATDRSTLDLADLPALRRALHQVGPDVIVNAAAYTAVDRAETERDLALRVNAEAPRALGEEARRLGALLVHYSTDYVFDGARRTPYREQDEPNPLSHYGRTKLEGERGAAESGARCLILRTSWVYGPRASNFYQVIRRKAEAAEPMLMVDDQTSVPTPSGFVAEQTLALLRGDVTGLVHLVPSGHATRFDFARAVVEAMAARSEVSPVTSDRFPSPARRPAYSVLDNAKLAREVGRPPDWRELLGAAMKAWTRP